MLNKVLETSKFVVSSAKHVRINYNQADKLIGELGNLDNTHYLAKLPYPIYDMGTKDIANFLLIYDAIDFSFWGNPKWTITVDGRNLDGGIALLHCLFNFFRGRDSVDVFMDLEHMTFKNFAALLKGNVEIPLLAERCKIVTNIAKTVNQTMNGNFYSHIQTINGDQELFDFILHNFPSFNDTRTYQGKTIHFYKLAQLLTSDLLRVIENKEHKKVDRSHLIGCADYKIPQVLRSCGVLEYDDELSVLVDTKTKIAENNTYEVEIRASMLVAIDYLWHKTNQSVDRIDINNYIWSKGQDKTKNHHSYHLTRTTSY